MPAFSLSADGADSACSAVTRTASDAVPRVNKVKAKRPSSQLGGAGLSPQTGALAAADASPTPRGRKSRPDSQLDGVATASQDSVHVPPPTPRSKKSRASRPASLMVTKVTSTRKVRNPVVGVQEADFSSYALFAESDSLTPCPSLAASPAVETQSVGRTRSLSTSREFRLPEANPTRRIASSGTRGIQLALADDGDDDDDDDDDSEFTSSPSSVRRTPSAPSPKDSPLSVSRTITAIGTWKERKMSNGLERLSLDDFDMSDMSLALGPADRKQRFTRQDPVRCVPTEDVGAFAKLVSVFNEIVVTELNYVDKLRALLRLRAKALFIGALSVKDTRKIFSSRLKDLYHTHKRIEAHISVDSPVCLVDAFSALLEDPVVSGYRHYVRRYSSYSDAFNKLIQRNQRFRGLVDNVGEDVVGLLMEPVQRIARYHLLFNQFLESMRECGLPRSRVNRFAVLAQGFVWSVETVNH